MRLYEFLKNAGDRPYRELIQHHIRKQDAQQLMAGAIGEAALLPTDLRPDVMTYVDTVNADLLCSQEFWRTATCKDAINAVLEIANEHFGLAMQIPLETASMSGVDQELAFGLFQIATLSFAYTAVGQPKAREFIGIRKSLFYR